MSEAQVQSPQPVSKSFVSPRITKGMTEEEIKQFENAYIRAKRVLKRIHDYAEREAKYKLELIDDPSKFLSEGKWHEKALWAAGYRHAMRVMCELTRT